MDVAVRNAWGDWLGAQPWDWFLTITFRNPVLGHRQESCLHNVGKWLVHKMEPASLFLAAEHHISRTIHLHGLYRSSSLPEQRRYTHQAERSILWGYLERTYGRSSVEIPRGAQAVTKYVSKYCVKASGYYEIW